MLLVHVHRGIYALRDLLSPGAGTREGVAAGIYTQWDVYSVT